ncbi:MAG TPA: efflux RND transporter periplasmic adaptor subunit [Chryseolinea sp.]|nr:efflux RND transporter periplasmic adaptor subunit [Chryseolinea sp.]
MNRNLIILVIGVLALSCRKKEVQLTQTTPLPVVEQDGAKITFANDPHTLSFFEVDTVRTENLAGTFEAPASVAVTIEVPTSPGGRGTVLFDNPDLGSTYSAFLQHLINIRTNRLNLERVQDLSQHGAATGKEVLDAETQLANEEAAITEQEAKLRIAGLDPEALKKPVREEAWLLCEVPESQVQQLKVGTPCRVQFTAYPSEAVMARVSGMGAEVDNVTRLVKARVSLPNHASKFQVGMFATVAFDMKSGNALSVPVRAIVNVQGKDFAFVATAPNVFERREVLLGQQVNDKAIVLHGLNAGDRVATKGAMELKGISFGY